MDKVVMGLVVALLGAALAGISYYMIRLEKKHSADGHIFWYFWAFLGAIMIALGLARIVF